MIKRREKMTAIFLICIMMLTSVSFVYANDVLPELNRKTVSDCLIKEIENVTFNGEYKTPNVTIYDGDYQLIENTDYELTYTNHYHAGVASVLIKGIGLYSGEISKTFTIEKADITAKGTNVSTTGKPKVTWDAVNGAEKYKLMRATKKNGTYSHLITTTKTSITNTSATRSKNYYYKVIVLDAEGKSLDFNESNIVSLTCKLPSPTVDAQNVAKTGKVKLTWKKISGAEKYAVYRSTKKDSGYTLRFTTKNTSYTNTNAVPGKKYYYKVKAIDIDNRKADSAFNKPVLRSCDLARPVISKIELNSNAKPKVTWKKISGADQYEVFRKVKDGSYKSIGTTSKSYYTDKTAKGGKIYYYKVRALDADNSGATSAKSYSKKTYVVDLNKKLVALTFDDGPGPYTKEIVKKLKNNNAKATFFVLGQRVSMFSDVLKYTYDNGCEIGNHSFDHTILSYVGSSEIKSQMSKTDSAIKNVVGITPALMRPPGGGVNSTVQKYVGKPIIYWSIDTLDWKTRSKSETVNCVMNNVKDGSIVLMHDIHEPTKDAALELIPKLKNKGYELVTVSELAKFKGKELKDGVVYYSF